MVNSSGAILSMMTGEMYESDSVEVRLVLRKGDRVAAASIEVLVVNGTPPVFGIE